MYVSGVTFGPLSNCLAFCTSIELVAIQHSLMQVDTFYTILTCRVMIVSVVALEGHVRFPAGQEINGFLRFSKSPQQFTYSTLQPRVSIVDC